MGRVAQVRGGIEEIRARQAAAAFLRAARLTEDPAEREVLRRKAAELLAPSRESVRSAEARPPARQRARP
jgi:hypothetical protein